MNSPLLGITFGAVLVIGLASSMDAQGAAGGGGRGGGGAAAAGAARTSINQNVQVNHNVNVNRQINVDVDNRPGNRPDYHPVARAALVAAVIGSVVYTLPTTTTCAPVAVNGVTYHNCDGTWYQPQFAGTQMTYVVVNAPQ